MIKNYKDMNDEELLEAEKKVCEELDDLYENSTFEKYQEKGKELYEIFLVAEDRGLLKKKK